MFCGTCGKKIKDGVKFCPFCGAPITPTVRANDAEAGAGDAAAFGGDAAMQTGAAPGAGANGSAYQPNMVSNQASAAAPYANAAGGQAKAAASYVSAAADNAAADLNTQVSETRKRGRRRMPMMLVIILVVLAMAATAFAATFIYRHFFANQGTETAVEQEAEKNTSYTSESFTNGSVTVPALAFDMPEGWEVDDSNWHADWSADGPGVSGSSQTSASASYSFDANELVLTNKNTGVEITLRVFMLGGYGGGAAGGQHLTGRYLADCDLDSTCKVGIYRTELGGTTGTLGVLPEEYALDTDTYVDGAENLGAGIIGRGPFYTSEATGDTFEFTFQTTGVDLESFDASDPDWAEVIGILSSLHEATDDAGDAAKEGAADTADTAASTYVAEAFSGAPRGVDGEVDPECSTSSFEFDVPGGWKVVSDELSASDNERTVTVRNESTGVTLVLCFSLNQWWGGVTVTDPFTSVADSSLGNDFHVGYYIDRSLDYRYFGIYENSGGVSGVQYASSDVKSGAAPCWSLSFHVDMEASGGDWASFDPSDAKWTEAIQIMSSLHVVS